MLKPDIAHKLTAAFLLKALFRFALCVAVLTTFLLYAAVIAFGAFQ